MATLIEWDDEFAVGVPAIDKDHWHLLNTLNVLYTQQEEQANHYSAFDFLNDVHAQLAGHFALEEKFMRRAQHPDLDVHHAAHVDLLDGVSDRMEEQAAAGSAFDAAAFGRYLREWLLEHFSFFDARLHQEPL